MEIEEVKKTIRLPEGEDFKLLSDIFTFQEESYEYIVLRSVNDMIEELEDPHSGLSEEKRKEYNKIIEEHLEIVSNFVNLKKKINQEGKEIELDDKDVSAFKITLEQQLWCAEERIEDFTEDRFGWGKENCSKLISQEKEIIRVIKELQSELGTTD